MSFNVFIGHAQGMSHNGHSRPSRPPFLFIKKKKKNALIGNVSNWVKFLSVHNFLGLLGIGEKSEHLMYVWIGFDLLSVFF